MASTIASRTPAGPAIERRSFNRNQIDIEDQGRSRGNDAARTVIAVGKVRGNNEPTTLADLHSGNALIPTLDDGARTQREFKGLTAGARAIELFALAVGCGRLVQPPGVLDHRNLSAGDRRTRAGLERYRLQRGDRACGRRIGGRRSRLAGASGEQRDEHNQTALRYALPRHGRHLKGFYRRALSAGGAQQGRAKSAGCCDVAEDAQTAEAHRIQPQATDGIVYFVPRL